MVEGVEARGGCVELMDELREKEGGLMFDECGGCWDGSWGMCFGEGDLLVGDEDKKVGEMGGWGFYIDEDEYE